MCACVHVLILLRMERERERGREGGREGGRKGGRERAREGGERAYPFIPQSFSRASSAIETDATQYTEGTVLPN